MKGCQQLLRSTTQLEDMGIATLFEHREICDVHMHKTLGMFARCRNIYVIKLHQDTIGISTPYVPASCDGRNTKAWRQLMAAL